VTYHKSDTSTSALHALFTETKPDIVISTVSGNSSTIQTQILAATLSAQIPRFIPYEFGQDSLNAKVQERLPPNRERAQTIAYLKQRSTESELQWVAIATGVDLDRGLMNGKLGFDIKWESAAVVGSGNESFAASSGAWTGKVVLAVLRHWESVKNQYLYAAGLITSADAIVTAFEKATGKSFVTSKTDVEDCVREAERRIERGFIDAGIALMGRSVMYDRSIEAAKPFEDADAKGRLGLEREKLEDIVEWVLHELKHHDNGGCGCD